jgi:hypothetical protein
MEKQSQSRRKFLQNGSVLIAGMTLTKLNSFGTQTALCTAPPTTVHNEPQVVLNDKRVRLRFGNERMVLNEGLQPSMLSTRTGTLVVQAQLPKKPYPQERIYYPFAMQTVVSRDKGSRWEEFKLPAGDNGVNMEGGAIQLKDGTVIVLETYVTPGEKPDTGEGLLYYSTDDWHTLKGPEKITFDIPNAYFYGSSDDGGRPQAAMRLHRRILELPNGDLLTTIYGWMKGDDAPCPYQPKMKKTRVMLFRSPDKGRHWNFVATVAADSKVGTEGFGEPVIVRVSRGPHAGRFICMMRTGEALYDNFSDDEGKTWSPPKPRIFAGIDVHRTALWEKQFQNVKRGGRLVTEVPYEITGAVVDPDLMETRSGILVAAFGVRIPAKACWIDPTFPWNGNYLAFSLDHGDSWSHVVRLTSGIPTTQYMAIEEMKEDNRLFVTYDYGFWNYKGGRYIYGRPVDLRV